MHAGHVLVVEDDDAIRRLLVEYLQVRSDLRVDSARDGAEALHRVKYRRYDVIVLDLLMPYMSGVDFLSSLHVLNIGSDDEPPAVFIVTGASQSDVPAEALEQNFRRFVRGVFRKPLDFVMLARCVEQALLPR
ncbi:MAG TPA: response regulator [Thermoanaerobaculia bacterium]|jgi:CheY-like chemotaxis protein